MFSIFKSKPKLQELIPTNYVDIHSHVLPGIDDGAKTIKDTEFILNEMSSFGFNKVITTPHTIKNVWDNSREKIEDTLDFVKEKLPVESSKMQLSCASEYFMDENFVNQLQTEKLLTLKDNYILVEMSYLNAPIQLYDIIFEIQLKGYQPILAHPERYTFYHSNFKEYDKLKKAGCLFQLNLLSSVGYYGMEVSNTATKLLTNNLIDFVGSDIHHENHIKAFKSKTIIHKIDALETAISKNIFFN